jgi:hypothetical protein
VYGLVLYPPPDLAAGRGVPAAEVTDADVLVERPPFPAPVPPEREIAPPRPPAEPVPGTSHLRGRKPDPDDGRKPG